MNPAVAAPLEKIIDKALKKDRSQRYQHARELLTDLEDLKGHRKWGLTASQATSMLRTARFQKWSPGRLWQAREVWLWMTIILFILASGAGLRRWLNERRASPWSPAQMEYTQLTNFADAVTWPALSPDGRMLAMIRGDSTFLGPGEIYLKLLPDGEAVQLTHDPHPKMHPVFSPDGAQIAFTRAEGWDWQTWTVSALGGEPSQLLPNASALTWVGPHRVMFSEMTSDGGMKLVTAGESRAGARDVYVPGPGGMAHESYLSPDSRWVLVAEMDGATGWKPCRLVALTGGSAGKQVGPIPSECTEAAWSPDGQWMYFAANPGRGFHLWRQRFPDGLAQQITFGASEEHGIAVAPDGKSLITSVGSRQYTVWVHTPKGERQISSEEFAFLASLSADGKTLYYLSRIGMGTVPSGQLWSVDLASGHKEQVLPGILVSRYSVSFDGKQVAFTRADSPGHSAIWISPVDRRSSPREIVSADADTPIFSRSGEIFFLREQGGAHYVFRMHKDGQLSKAHPNPVDGLVSLSPDGKWVVVSTHNDDPTRQAVVALALLGGRSRVLCQGCAVGSMEIDPPLVSWSMDQRSIYVSLAKTGLNDQPKTMLIPLRPGEAFPKLPSDELVNNPQLSRIPGLRTVNHPSVFPGPDPSIYAFWNTSTQRNLYRITLP